jgi:integrase
MRKLFPEDLAECVRIWGALECYFLMMYAGGLRPQEVSAFELADWIQEEHGAVFHQRLDTPTLQVLEGLETVKTGMTVKAVPFPDRLEEALHTLIFRGAPKKGLFFRFRNGHPIRSESGNKHFRASAVRAGVELGKRTQYSLRHTYYTELLKVLPERDVEQLAGHTTVRKEYDHRKGIDFLRRRASIR